MKKVSEHLGEIIIALAAIALLVTAVVVYREPIGGFFDNIVSGNRSISVGILDNVEEKAMSVVNGNGGSGGADGSTENGSSDSEENAYVAVPASYIAASSLIGLGVGPEINSDSSAFTQMVNEVTTYLDKQGFVSDENTVSVLSTSDSDVPYMVDQSLIETVQDWFFQNYNVNTETGEITEFNKTAPSGHCYYNGVLLPDPPHKYVSNTENLIFLKDGVYYWAYGDGSNYFYADHKKTDGVYTHYIYTNMTCYLWSYSSTDRDWTNKTAIATDTYVCDIDEVIWIKFTPYTLLGSGWNCDTCKIKEGDAIYSKTYETVLAGEVIGTSTNYIGSSDSSFNEGYSEWANGAITFDGIVFYPIGLGKSLEETMDLTQAEVWAGKSTY